MDWMLAVFLIFLSCFKLQKVQSESNINSYITDVNGRKVFVNIGPKFCKKVCLSFDSFACSGVSYDKTNFICYIYGSTTPVPGNGAPVITRAEILAGGSESCGCNPGEKCITLHGNRQKCIVNGCSDPPSVQNSFVNSGENTVSASRTYACNTTCAYSRMTGNSTLTCKASGSWTNINFTCDARTIEVTSSGYGYVPLLQHGIDVTSKSCVLLDVKTCQDAQIGLITGPTTMYEIVLGAGSDSYSVIRNQTLGQNKATYFGSLLDCNMFKPFWIDWGQGTIRVGTGSSVGIGQILQWTDPVTRSVQEVQVSSYGPISAVWNL